MTLKPPSPVRTRLRGRERCVFRPSAREEHQGRSVAGSFPASEIYVQDKMELYKRLRLERIFKISLVPLIQSTM